MLHRGKHDSHIDPPTSSNAIMQWAQPYYGENSEPGRYSIESLTTNPRVREHPESKPEVANNDPDERADLRRPVDGLAPARHRSTAHGTNGRHFALPSDDCAGASPAAVLGRIRTTDTRISSYQRGGRIGCTGLAPASARLVPPLERRATGVSHSSRGRSNGGGG